jgi:hypothetical protein
MLAVEVGPELLQALQHLLGPVPIDAPQLAADALGLALDRLELERNLQRS